MNTNMYLMGVLMTLVALVFAGAIPAMGGPFPANFDLSTLDGTNGFLINGIEGGVYSGPDLIDAGDNSGSSVSAAGDVNGDGIDDLLIGAVFADPNGAYSGQSYVVFGTSQGFASPLELSALDGTNGFKINGIAAGDTSGSSVSAAGDVNGDGIDDLLIGAPRAVPNGYESGQSYVVFGTSQGFASPLELSALDGTNGFKINGIAVGDTSGSSVSAAGDVNGDGIDDLLIGADNAAPNGAFSGQSYVVFGTAQGFASSFELSALDGTNGFIINGIAPLDSSGSSVSAAGDVNGDGTDDLLIGAYGADPNGLHSGMIYVVFGTDQGFASPLELSALDGTNGFKINGIAALDWAGYSVSAARDVNGDGIDDLLIGARYADPNGPESGQSYVVFGQPDGITVSIDIMPGSDQNPINLSSSGVIPVAILGSETFDATAVNGETVRFMGASVKMTGKGGKYLCHEEDVNGDGYTDKICQISKDDALQIQPGDALAILTAETYSGDSIRGEDSIRIVKDQ